jgi:hypothetical protein
MSGTLTRRTPARLAPEARSVDADGRRRWPVAMVVANLALLVVALLIQLALYSHGGHKALSDLPRVFLHRGVGPGSLPYIDRVIEYPVGAGMLLYLASLAAPTALGVLLVTAAGAAALSVAITVALERRCGGRAWRWAIGTPILLYAFQNWDVFAIAAMLVGMFAFRRGRNGRAGAALGLGAAIKLFPAVLVPPLAVYRWVTGDRRGAVRLVGWSAVVFGALNLPFIVAKPSGWAWTFAFQGRRQATWGTVWFWLDRNVGVAVRGHAGAQLANELSALALAIGLLWLLWRVVRTRGALGADGAGVDGAVDAGVSLAAAAVAIFLLTNKVYSPTYDIWMVVFFALLPLSRRIWIAFCAVDLLVFATVYGWFHGVTSTEVLRIALPVLVVLRAAILVRVVVVATRRYPVADRLRSHGTPAATAAIAAASTKSHHHELDPPPPPDGSERVATAARA